MIKIITAINNPKINEELNNEKDIQVIGKDILYKEGILEILEKKIKINYIIINSEILGEITLNNLIKKINEKNKKIKIILLIKTKNNEIKNNLNNKIKNNIILNNKILFKKNKKINNIKIIKNKKEKNIIKIFYDDKIDTKDLKLILNDEEKNRDFFQKKEQKSQKKILVFLGNKQVGKSMTIALISLILEQKGYKILILELNKKESDILFMFGKKVEKEKLISKIKNNIDLICNKSILKNNLINKIEKNYDYILIEDNFLNYNFWKNKKIISIINSNLLDIKNTKNIIEKNEIKNIYILINKYNKYSIYEEIIKNILKNKIIGKIDYNEQYENLINSNFKISKKEINNILEKIEKLEIDKLIN